MASKKLERLSRRFANGKLSEEQTAAFQQLIDSGVVADPRTGQIEKQPGVPVLAGDEDRFDKVKTDATRAAAGFTRGLAEQGIPLAVGGPVEVANMAAGAALDTTKDFLGLLSSFGPREAAERIHSLLDLRAAPLVERPIGGIQQMAEFGKEGRSAFNQLTGLNIGDVPPAETLRERAVDRAGEEVGAALPLIAGEIGLLGRAAAPGRIRTGAPSTVEMLATDLAQVGPGNLSAIEGIVAGAAGMGGQAAADLAPVAPEIARMATMIIISFGAVPGLSFVRGIRKLAEKPLTQAEMQHQAGLLLNRIVSEQELFNTQTGRALAESAETGIPLTTAAATQDPGLIQAGRDIAGDVPGVSARLAERGRATELAVRGAVETPPGGLAEVTPRQAEAAVQRRARQTIEAGEAAEAERVAASEARLQATAEGQVARIAGRDQAVNQRLTNAQAKRQQRLADLQADIDQRLGNIGELSARAENRAQRAIDDLDVEADATGRLAQQQGRIIRAEAAQREAQFRRDAEELYSKVDPGGVAQFPMAKLRATANDIITPRNKAEASAAADPKNVPEVARVLTDGKTFVNDSEPLEEMLGIRRLITDAIANNDSSTAPNRTLARNLTRLFQVVNESIEDAGVAQAYPGIAERLSAAQTFYKEGARRVREGAMEPLVRKESTRRAVADEDATRLFLKADSARGARSAMEDFVNNFGDQPPINIPAGKDLPPISVQPQARSQAAFNALEEALINDFLVFTNKGGKFNAKRARIWLEKRNTQLSFFPETQSKLRNVASAREFADSRLARQQAARKIGERKVGTATRAEETAQAALEREGRAEVEGLKLAESAEFEAARRAESRALAKIQDEERSIAATMLEDLDADPRALGDRIINSKQPTVELRRAMRVVKGDEEAERGLKRLYWDAAARRLDASSKDLFGDVFKKDPIAFGKFLESQEPVLRRLYGDEHFNFLKTVERLAFLHGQTSGTTTAFGFRASARDEIFMFTLNQLLTRAYNIARNVVSPTFIAGEVSSRLLFNNIARLNQQQIKALLGEALVDPEVARTLMMMARNPRVGQTVRRLNVHLLDAGLPPAEDESPGPALPVQAPEVIANQ